MVNKKGLAMGYTEMGKLIDQVLQDGKIRDLLRKDPREAARHCGITLTADEVAALRQVDWNLNDAELKSRISKL